ncbi:hypothetical protein DPPLL_34940 [Desulfofustis limnaeus]|uniref:Glycosyl transferase family 1 domain-containing protein n=2 Tax=Desulfofustis limnaeus TaxID=2740163 RepID=A0ABM7WDR2_9BACT|nr:hypothetical protein DPPLL_34940 [Desulfofustis limnaeus]
MASLLVNHGYQVTFLAQRHDSYNPDVFSVYYPKCSIVFVDLPSESSFVPYSPSGGLVSHERLAYSAEVRRVFDRYYDSHGPCSIVGADFGAELFQCLLSKQAGAYAGSSFFIFVEGSTYDAIKTYESGTSSEVSSELDDPQNRLTCAMEDACVHLADRVIFPTRITREETQGRLGIPLENTVIPNIVGPGFLHLSSEKVYRQQTGTMLFVGRLDFHKGADTLLQAFLRRFADTAEENIPFLRMVGRDTFCKSYGRSFLDHWLPRIPEHLLGHIEFTGQVDPRQVGRYLCEATLCVFPSRWEVFGIVCLEAMASGCPVAVTKATGLAEVVGEAFPELLIDFPAEGDKVFDLFQNLVSMDEARYENLCLAMSERAEVMVAKGNDLLLQLFDKPIPSPDTASADGNTIRFLQECLLAVTDITSTIANDFNRVTNHYGIDDDTLKRLLSPVFPGPEKSWPKPASLNERLVEFLKKRVSKFLS